MPKQNVRSICQATQNTMSGPVTHDATLIRNALRSLIHRCLKPPHFSATDTLSFGGSPQRKIYATHCRKSGNRKSQLTFCVYDLVSPVSNLNVRRRLRNRRNRHNQNFFRKFPMLSCESENLRRNAGTVDSAHSALFNAALPRCGTVRRARIEVDTRHFSKGVPHAGYL